VFWYTNKMIKAVVFDFFGVICTDDYWRFVNGLGVDGAKLGQYKASLNTGKMPWQSYVANVAELVGRPVDEVSSMYAQENLDPRVLGLITQLHNSYKTALLTNANQEFIDDILKQRGLHNIFNEVIVSSTVGVAKPDPGIYQYALNKLGCQPAEMLFIDDLPRHIYAADSMGIKTVLFSNFEQCLAEINHILYDL